MFKCISSYLALYRADSMDQIRNEYESFVCQAMTPTKSTYMFKISCNPYKEKKLLDKVWLNLND